MKSDLWNRLQLITQVEFSASSNKGDQGWNGNGQGDVIANALDKEQIVFDESGVWTTNKGIELQFNNQYRWRKIAKSNIALEHLRYGNKRAVSLVELEPTKANRWQTVQPHQCNQDLYILNIEVTGHSIQMLWQVLGPKKDEKLVYMYF